MSSDELNESQRALQSIDDESIFNISDIVSKLKSGNQKFQNKIRGRKLRQMKQMRRKWHRLAAQMRKQSIQLAKSEYDEEKRRIAEQEEMARREAVAREEAFRYEQEELLRREREAQIAKDASKYVHSKNANISIDIDIDDDDEEEEDQDEDDQIANNEIYSLIEEAFFPSKTRSKSKAKDSDISRDVDNLDLEFLQKGLDESTNKFMFNVLFSDAFRTIIREQSKLADQTLKKCITEKTMDRFKLIGPMLEGAANQ